MFAASQCSSWPPPRTANCAKQYDLSQAVVAFEHAASLYRRLGDCLGSSRSLLSLAMDLAFMGRLEQEHAYSQKLCHTRSRRLPKALARYFDALGFLATLSGDFVSARKHYEKALTFSPRHRRRTRLARYAGQSRGRYLGSGYLDAALSGCRKTIAILRDPPASTSLALGRNLLNLSGILTERGELDEAFAAALEGLPLIKEMGTAWSSLDHPRCGRLWPETGQCGPSRWVCRCSNRCKGIDAAAQRSARSRPAADVAAREAGHRRSGAAVRRRGDDERSGSLPAGGGAITTSPPR